MSKCFLECWGGVGAVTGANFLLEVNSKKYLVDCGLLQGVQSADATNAEKFDYDVETIEALFITHAHIDHIGKIPKLVKDGFKGIIYSTPETKELSKLMLEDTARITEEHARIAGVEPLYTLSDAGRALTRWQTVSYHSPKEFGDFSVELYDAGHILGSSMYKFTFPSGKSILFTGDLGNTSPILHETEEVSGLTYVLMDSVYGDRNHESPAERDRKFAALVEDVIEHKRTLIIPIFSLERTQVILFDIKKLFESKALKSIPVFLDSPLAIRVTEAYERLMHQSFEFPKLTETVQARDSKEIILVPGPKIILAGSGMSTAGRILHHEEQYLPDENATILFVGYQAPGTLGRQIVEGAKKVSIHDTEVPVRAKVVSIDGFSAHKDSDHLVEFVSHTKDTLRQVFVTMGEPKSSIYLAQRLHDELDVNAIVPERGKRYELDL
ncbi:MBL fold metallo-hydrolase [Candidatus Parcubacteria bacterium]|nr:MBL fold metallo-hydrolase [Candidatus Parcubacteria bacterium]